MKLMKDTSKVLLSSQMVVNLTLELANPLIAVSAPTAGKEKPAVQEKPSNGHSSVAEAKHQVTREESPPFVNRFPTFRPIGIVLPCYM